MSNWRPEGWATHSVKSYTHKDAKDCTGREIFEAGADAMLEAISEEIEKVENPYPPTRKCADEDGAIQEYVNVSHTRVEEFRQEILALLK